MKHPDMHNTPFEMMMNNGLIFCLFLFFFFFFKARRLNDPLRKKIPFQQRRISNDVALNEAQPKALLCFRRPSKGPRNKTCSPPDVPLFKAVFVGVFSGQVKHANRDQYKAVLNSHSRGWRAKSLWLRPPPFYPPPLSFFAFAPELSGD